MPRINARDIADLPEDIRRQIEAEYQTDEAGTPGRVVMSDKERARQQYKPREAQEAGAVTMAKWAAATPAERERRLVLACLDHAEILLSERMGRRYLELTGCDDMPLLRRWLQTMRKRLEVLDLSGGEAT